MKIILSLIFLSLSSICSYGVTWEKLFSAKSTDVFRSVREVPAGGYICAGYTADSTVNDSDAYAVRLDTNGDTIWTFKYNSGNNKKDLFYKVIPTSDGGFAFTGWSTGTGNSDDVLILKLSSGGSLEWVKKWGGSTRDRGQDIIETSGGDFTVVGYTTSAPAVYYDAFLFRLNDNGDSLGFKRYTGGAGSYDDANSVKQLPDNGYILGGQSSNGGINGLDQYLIRTDALGNQIWAKRFGTTGTDNIHCVTLIPDGFLLAGSTEDSSDNGYLVKTDTAGNIDWAYAYGDSLPDDFHSVELTSGGNYIACGTTSSIGPAEPNIWLAKINDSGTLLWQKTYGGHNHDHGYSAEQTIDGGYIVAGHTGSYGYNFEEAYVIKTDANGDISDELVYTSIFSLVSPTPGSCGSPNTPVKLKLRNFSNASIPNIPVNVEVTGAGTQSFNQNFSASGDTVTIGTLNTSAGGTFTFVCTTGNNNDVYPQRNTITISVTLNPFNDTPIVTGDDRCGNGSVALNATSNGTVYWYTSAIGGSPVANGSTYNSPSISSTTTYYAQTGIVCASQRVPVVAEVFTMPVNPVSQGDSRCGPGAMTINVTSPDPVSWYTVASGGSPFTTGLSYTTPSLSSTTTYYIEASNASCTTARFPVVATVSSVAADPITTNGTRCGTGSVVLNATSSDPLMWYDAPSGGNQVGTGNPFITPVISTTTTYYAEADNGCVSNRVMAIAIVNTLAANPVGNSTQRCGPGSVPLTATSVDALNWYNASTGGNQVGSGSPFNTPSISTTTTYYVEAFNGNCPSNRVPVVAIINPLPVVNLGNDTNLVAPPYLLDAGAGFVSYSWSTGATTQNISTTIPDTYCVTVTNAQSCTNTDCIFVDFSIGITEKDFAHVNIYPNPTGGLFHIELPTGENALVKIMSSAGQVLLIKEISGIENDIDLGRFAKGVYYLSIQNEKGVINRKIYLQ